MTVRINDTVRSDMADVIKTALDAGLAGGLLKIYSGAKPVVKGTPPAGVLLASLTLFDPVGSVVSGVLTFTVPFSVNALATGVATFFYLEDSTGAFVLDGDVSTPPPGSAELVLTSTSLIIGKPVDILSFTISLGGA